MSGSSALDSGGSCYCCLGPYQQPAPTGLFIGSSRTLFFFSLCSFSTLSCLLSTSDSPHFFCHYSSLLFLSWLLSLLLLLGHQLHLLPLSLLWPQGLPLSLLLPRWWLSVLAGAGSAVATATTNTADTRDVVSSFFFCCHLSPFFMLPA
jgi:hypothetical protein